MTIAFNVGGGGEIWVVYKYVSKDLTQDLIMYRVLGDLEHGLLEQNNGGLFLAFLLKFNG